MRYAGIAEVYDKLESSTKRLEKTYYIAELLKKVSDEDIEQVILLLQGKVFPNWDNRKIGVASKLIAKAIAKASGLSMSKVEDSWKKTGDLGKVAEKYIGKGSGTLATFGATGSSSLSVRKVFETLQKLPAFEGAKSVDVKLNSIVSLLSSAKPNEAKYIVRTVLEEMRVGVGEGVLRDAIVWACFGDEFGLSYDNKENIAVVSDENREKYNSYVGKVQHAYDMSNDFSVVFKHAKKDELSKIKLLPLKPVKVMLYQKALGIEDAFSRVGRPAAFEYKYDGFRLNVHRNKDKIRLFTRRLEDVTLQFPDVVETVIENVKSDNYIIDGEVIGIDKKGKWMPFQNISQRIRRKYDIKDMAKDIPVMLNVFDVIMIDGKSMIDEPFSIRRKAIEKAVKESLGKISLAKQIITEDVKVVEKFYKEALAKGNEGIMAKNLSGVYKPGSRVGYGVKIKPTMEHLDLVITSATWGEGKRAKWLSSFTLSCISEGKFYTIGKVGTGIKELEGSGVTFEELTNLLKPLITSESGSSVNVKPKIVVEVAYEEIQKSPTYSSGYALRFPRVVVLREDRDVSDVSTIEMVEKFYSEQH